MDLPNQASKRPRGDSELNSPVSKHARLDSLPDFNSALHPLARSDPEHPPMDSSFPTHIQNDLFNILVETDHSPERGSDDTAMQGLDSVIKSFEEEILAPGTDSAVPDPTADLHVELGYLLEASDDELGLPPSATATETEADEAKPESEELSQAGSDGADMEGELLGFENEMENSESVGLGGGENEKGGGIVNFEGLLDYPESYDVVWRSGSLQAM